MSRVMDLAPLPDNKGPRPGGTGTRGKSWKHRALVSSFIVLALQPLVFAGQPGADFCTYLRAKPADVAASSKLEAAYYELDPWRTSWLPRFVLYENNEVLLSPTGWLENGVWFSKVTLDPAEAEALRRKLTLAPKAGDLDPFYNLAPNVSDLHAVVVLLPERSGRPRVFEVYGYSLTSAAYTVLAPDPDHPADALPRILDTYIRTMRDFRHAGATPWRPEYLEVTLTPEPAMVLQTATWPAGWPGLRDPRTRTSFQADNPRSAFAGGIDVYLEAGHQEELARYLGNERRVFPLEEGLWSVRDFAPVFPGRWELDSLTRCDPSVAQATYDKLVERKAAKRKLQLVTYLLIALAIAGTLRLFSTLALLGWFSGLLTYAQLPMDLLRDQSLLIVLAVLGSVELVVDKVRSWRPCWNAAMRVVRPVVILAIATLSLRGVPAAQLAVVLGTTTLLALALDAARSRLRRRIDPLPSHWWGVAASFLEDLGCIGVLWLVHVRLEVGVLVSIGCALLYFVVAVASLRLSGPATTA